MRQHSGTQDAALAVLLAFVCAGQGTLALYLHAALSGCSMRYSKHRQHAKLITVLSHNNNSGLKGNGTQSFAS